jgi:hypothetical protein
MAAFIGKSLQCSAEIPRQPVCTENRSSCGTLKEATETRANQAGITAPFSAQQL